MDTESVGLLFRGSERLIVVLAAFSAIWLGYRLFDRVVSDRGAFEGKIGEWQIKLQRIAPGVFFAMFGASILVFALNAPFKQTPSSGSVGGETQSTTEYVNPQVAATEQTRALDAIVAMSTAISLLNNPTLTSTLEPVDQNLAIGTVSKLILHRDMLIDDAYGKGWRQKYYDIAQKVAKDERYLNEVDPQDAATFKAIKGAMGAASGS